MKELKNDEFLSVRVEITDTDIKKLKRALSLIEKSAPSNDVSSMVVADLKEIIDDFETMIFDYGLVTRKL